MRREKLLPKILRTARPDEIDAYGNAFGMLATCACGREVEIEGAYEATRGNYLKIEAMRARMRCSKCGARMPKLGIYVRPRPGSK